MLCTFTTQDDRTLVIRSEDIKRIEDDGPGAMLAWLEGTERFTEHVAGTARENMARLQQEELEAMARVNAYQQMAMPKLPPMPPVPRGKPKLVK